MQNRSLSQPARPVFRWLCQVLHPALSWSLQARKRQAPGPPRWLAAQPEGRASPRLAVASDRAALLELLQDSAAALTADSDEVLGFIERQGLYGKGIGYVDVHLLAAVVLTDGSKLWTRNKRLRTVAQGLALAYEGAGPH